MEPLRHADRAVEELDFATTAMAIWKQGGDGRVHQRNVKLKQQTKRGPCVS